MNDNADEGINIKPQGGSENKDEIPAFRISPKKVDDSWKEEMRREKEAAAARASSAAPRSAPQAEARGPAPASAAPSPKGPPQEESVDEDETDFEQEEESSAPTKKGAEQQQSEIFMTFLARLAQQALMQLGEIENPFSGQRELDLKGARYTIELLTVLQQKTRGNVSEEEGLALNEAIHDLKMRYIEVTQEVQRQMAAQMAQKGGPGGMRPGPGGSIPGIGKRG